MASRRKLKKAIKAISNELVAEIYILSFFKEVKEEKLNEVVDKALVMNEEFVSRVNHVDGKNDSKVVRAYFKKLREDWTNAIQEIVKEVEKL